MFPLDTRILVLDDIPSIRDLVKNHLIGLGYKNLLEGSDGQEGHQILIKQRAAGTSVQLVICDWNMPVLSGIELLKTLRASSEWKDLPFVMLTSEAELEQVTEAVLAGVSQYVVKPFSVKIFEEKLRSLWLKLNK